ncbi:MAG: MFS transporter [Longimicrobiales bacterium]
MTPMRPPLHRNVWVASATSFLTDVSSEMLQTVLPLFLANVLGVRIWAVGAVEGLAETTAAVVKLYSGWISDRVGRRKWLAVAGYGVSAAAKPFYWVAGSWLAVAGVRWADRLGKGVRSAPRDALLADSEPPERRGLAFGLHRAADTLGAVVGLALAIQIVRSTQADGALLTGGTFRALVAWSLVPAFLGVVVLAAGLRDVARPDAARPGDPPRPSPPPRPTVREFGGPFVGFLVASGVFALGNSADAFLVLRAQERGLGVDDVLWTLLAFNVVYSVVSTPAGALADRVPRTWVLAGGWVLYALVYLGFATAASAPAVVVLYLVYGAYHGLVAGAAQALVADLVPPERRGTGYGTYHALVGVLALPASLAAGVLWEGIGSWAGLGPAAPFWFGAGTAALATAILLATVPARPRP